MSQKAAKKRKVIYEQIPMKPFEWFERYHALSVNMDNHVLLESGRSGTYSIIGLSPVAIVKGKNNRLTIVENGKQSVKNGPLLQNVKEWFSHHLNEPIEGLPDFYGGAIGYISYDVVREIERLPEMAIDDLDMPDIYLLVFDDVFVYDHQKEVLWIIVNDTESETLAQKRLKEHVQSWTAAITEKPVKRHVHKKIEQKDSFSFTEEQFMKAVDKVKEYIAAGDVFQVNLSVRQSKPLETQAMDIYEQLRLINPSPYMSYFHTPEFQLVSGSPELLVKKKGSEISTRPIAGTRSRGKTEMEDDELAKSLIENEKERAEHVMLVDLERNDLGKVSQYGSVEVNEFMVIEKYSHVMHIVSNVRGMLREECDAFDVIEAAFPGGTITGAPKVRTMEIIEELEPTRRGIYTGSIGWIGYNGDLELNIAIRTMIVKDGLAHVQAGAGIVIDSDPKAEYKESLKKAKALWRAKDLSENQLMDLGQREQNG